MTDEEIKRLHPQVVNMGRIYRVLWDVSRNYSKSLKSADMACVRPWLEMPKANIVAFSRGLGTKHRRMLSAITTLYNTLDIDDQSMLQSLDTLPLELQNSFMMGYFLGLRGVAFPSHITYYRNLLGETQKQLAEAIGATQAEISRWENGEVNPRTETLEAMAEHFGCSVDDLLYQRRSDQAKPQQILPVDEEE